MAELSPLRPRMIEDMAIRNLSPATRRSYLLSVTKLSRYVRRSPNRLGLDQVRAFQVHLVWARTSWPAKQEGHCWRCWKAVAATAMNC
jgi:integrase/recombinase XerD